MKHILLIMLRRCHFPVMLLLSAAPLIIMQLFTHAPDALPVFVALSTAYVLLCALCLLVPAKVRLPVSLLCDAVLLTLGFLLLPSADQPLIMLLPTVLCAMLMISLPVALRRYESEISPFFYFAGIAVHIVVQFLVHHFDQQGTPFYAPLLPALTGVSLAYILLLLMSMNRISLDNATLARYRLPQSIRRFNTVLTLGFMAISLILALMPTVVRGITLLWKTLLAVIARVSAFLLNLLPTAPDYGSMSGAPSEFGLPQGAPIETNRFAVLLEKFFSVLTAVFVVVGALILLRLLLRLIKRIVRHLIARLHRYIAEASTEYDDEITDTREDGAQRNIQPLLRSKRRTQTQDMTPIGRIRQMYARLLRRHPMWTESSTARENLPPDAAALYERARYSEHDVTPEDAERFAAGVKKL